MPPNAATIKEPVQGLPSRALEEERAKLLDRRESELRALACDLEARREQLAIASRSQAEFIANLSHELRTPLNSVLILSRLLVDNSEANLSEKQQAFARTIYSSGNDLLALINDVIELSRIQAGTLSLEPEEILVEDVCGLVAQSFGPLAAERSIAFSVDIAPGVPKTLFTDGRRLQQVLKNLLLNAFKFTERGRIALSVEPATEEGADREVSQPAVMFSVIDTGIGVPEAQRATIFEPFQQAGGKPVRGQRGAGLGLSLVRELCKLLGGEVRLADSSASGSTFIARIPVRRPPEERPPQSSRMSLATEDSAPASPEPIRAASRAAVVVVSANGELAHMLEPFAAGAGLDLLRRKRADEIDAATPLSAVVLDLRSPGLECWIALERMVRDLRSRHVPVFAFAGERDRAQAARIGAFLIEAFTPEEMRWIVDQAAFYGPEQQRRLLAIAAPSSLRELALGEGLETLRVSAPAEVERLLSTQRFHALLIEPRAAEGGLRGVLEALPPGAGRMPIVVYAETPLSDAEKRLIALHAARRSIAVAGTVELAALELSIALHRAHESFSAAERERLERAGRGRLSIEGRRVLVIDDDVRNIFAVTSVLERHGVRVLYAESGRQGLELLEQTRDIDAVLVDIKMSDQDGYEVVRAVRADPSRANLPLIVVTAQAMPADREKCLASGATHYLSKPTTAALLVSTLRVATMKRG